ALSTNCENRAIAISSCRDIEYARCQAGTSCGLIEEEDVDECIRFYRDQCLHGINGPRAPSKSDENECVAAIEAAGECASTNPNPSMKNCWTRGPGAGGASSSSPSGTSVCDFISEPWDDAVCEVLLPAEGEGGS